MKRYLSFIFIFMFFSQQAFASYIIYNLEFSHKGTHPNGSPVDFYRYTTKETKTPNIGEMVLLRNGNEVFKAVYEGNITERGETGPFFKDQEFVGTADSDQGAIQLYEGGLSTQDAEVPPTSTPTGPSPGEGARTQEGASNSENKTDGGPDLGSPLDSFLGGVGDVGTSGLMSGAIAGASVAISRGLIYTDDVLDYFEKTQTAVNESKHEIEQSKQRVNQFVQQTNSEFVGFINSLAELSKNPAVNGSSVKFAEGRQAQFTSQNIKFVKELSDITNVLDSAKAESFSQQQARALGYSFVSTADQSYTAGSYSDAYAYRNYALAMADIAVGLDPVTGTARSIYEAFTGKNLITGETLTTTERAFAVAGTLSLGYGNKLGQGFKAISKMVAGGRFSKALGVAATRAKKLIDSNFITKAFRAKQLDKYYDYLRKTDPDSFRELQRHFDQFPEKKEKYLSLLKDREGMDIKYWKNEGSYIQYQQSRSVEALEELEKALDSNATFVRYGGRELTIREQVEFIQKHGKMPPSPTRININTVDAAEAPVHWARYDGKIEASRTVEDFGLYSKGDAFEEYARLKPGAKIVTGSSSEGYYINEMGQKVKTLGGKIEVIIEQGGAETFKFIIKE